MSDILINNHLEGAALSLVRSVNNTDEIRRRLKSAYGDPKLLLKKNIRDQLDSSTFEIKRYRGLWQL